MNFTVKKVESSQQVTLTKVSVIDNNQFAKLRVSEKERKREEKWSKTEKSYVVMTMTMWFLTFTFDSALVGHSLRTTKQFKDSSKKALFFLLHHRGIKKKSKWEGTTIKERSFMCLMKQYLSGSRRTFTWTSNHLKLLRFTDPQTTCRTNRNINFNLQNYRLWISTEKKSERENISIYFYQPHPTAFVFIIQHNIKVFHFATYIVRKAYFDLKKAALIVKKKNAMKCDFNL